MTRTLLPADDSTIAIDQMEASRRAEDRRAGMGAILHDGGVAFRVWAPNADSVSVVGDFNHWSAEANPMHSEQNGYWYADVDVASVGSQYKYHIRRGDQQMDRIDPYAREVTNSIGNAIVTDPAFDWGDDDFQMPPHNEIVIYEMHIGTFSRSDENSPGSFADAEKRMAHLKQLGVNVLQLMPVAEFAGDLSWGYNPAHIFAIESAYGGPNALKEFVKKAHAEGFAVLMDVVYNHFGPSDLDLWQFDGWSKNGKGGIYFYSDHRSSTPWGETRPDYGRGEVRQLIYDNAKMWLEEYHVDGLRYDMTAYIRTISGIGHDDISEGWSLMQWINRDLSSQFPGCLLVAEDLQKNNWLTKLEEHGGAGFSSQWDAAFVHPIREAVRQIDDAHRDMWSVRNALCHRYNDNAFERVIYSESHDEVANGKSRVTSEVDVNDADGKLAQQRSVLAAALTLTAPGIPMLFQGQELLEDKWFDDADPLDWNRAERFSGIARLYADLISLRLNRDHQSSGLLGQFANVHHVNDGDKVIAFVRGEEGLSDVLVIANFANRSWEHYEIGCPSAGEWQLRFNSAWIGYSEAFDELPTGSVTAEPVARDGLSATGKFAFGPYAVMIYSKDA